MELNKAQVIASEVVNKLSEHCSRLEIAGSIRRRKSIVHDIDIICIPSNLGQFAYALQSLGKIIISGSKIIRVGMGFTKGLDLDVYIATPETWATLLLIRTGSKEHNIKLCARARNRGMVLHADGTGLFRLTDCQGTEERIAGDTEQSIFEALELPYVAPEGRG